MIDQISMCGCESNSSIKWISEWLNKISLEPFSLNFILGPRQVGIDCKVGELKVEVKAGKPHGKYPRDVYNLRKGRYPRVLIKLEKGKNITK
ncbi:MAG: hypothetical protein ACTSYM_03470 [Candidatus Baldrarchaeia archaeon]